MSKSTTLSSEELSLGAPSRVITSVPFYIISHPEL